MQEISNYASLDEKALEIILNFKDSPKYDKFAVKQILGLKEDIKNVINLLKEEEKQILHLRFNEGLSVEKISQAIGKPKEEVSKYLKRSIEQIKAKVRTGLRELAKTNNNFQGESLAAPANIGERSFLASIISIVVFIVVFTFTLLFAQKYLPSNFVPFKQFLSSTTTDIFSQLVETIHELSLQSNIKKRNTKIKNIDPKNIKISGSTSLLLLSRKWKDGFSIEYPKYTVNLVSSDSNEGINALTQGDIDIANSSRPVTYADQKNASENGVELNEVRIALDALIVIVNKNNQLNELTVNNLKDIFSAELKSWQELNGKNIPIIPVVREKGSGTNDFVTSRILEDSDFPSSVIRKNSTEEIIKYVSENEGAISFVNSVNYPKENQLIKYLSVKSFDNAGGFSPFEGNTLNEQAIRYGDYPLAHYLYLITLANPREKVQDFIDWVLTPKGQEVVRYSGLIPVSNEE